MKILVLFAILLQSALTYSEVFACSSCGSGSVDPIILFPNENQKFYIGLAAVDQIKDIDSRGDIRSTPGLKRQSILTVSAATRIAQTKGFLSLTSSQITNESSSSTRSGNSDPLLAFRYDLIRQSFANPEIPQIQVILSHRQSHANSIHNSRHPQYLDVFGPGFHNTSGGIDLWWGMWRHMFGGSLFYTYTHEASKNEMRLTPGDSWTGIVTIGQVWYGVKVISGFIATNKNPLKDDYGSVDVSAQRDRSLYVTLETLYLKNGNFRLTYSQQGVVGSVMSTAKKSFILAYMRGFL